MTKAQIIKNMDFEEYLSLDRLSASSLKNFKKSPAYYYQKKQQPNNPTKAMNLGTMVHTWMLENPKFNHLYYSMPEIEKPDIEKPEKPYPDIRKKEVKDLPEVLEYKKELAYYNQEIQVYKDTIQAYEDSAGDKEIYPEEIIKRYTQLPVRNDTTNEVTVLWEFEGIKCKSRFDMLHFEGDKAIGVEDLKTIADIFNIDRDFYKFGYHLQAGFYAQAFKEAFGDYPNFFHFTFVSTDPSYFDMVTCPISFEYLELGRMHVIDLMREFKECTSLGEFSGIESFEIEPPKWM